jgi:hypothetical protein
MSLQRLLRLRLAMTDIRHEGNYDIENRKDR